MLPSPLRARFGFTAHLDFYPHEELEKLIERSANVLGVNLDTGSAHGLALRSRGTPRIANRLLRRVRDWAIVHDLIVVRPDDVKEALALYQIDSEGLDRLDIAVLNAIVRNFNGGPVGLNNLAAMVGEESETVETVLRCRISCAKVLWFARPKAVWLPRRHGAFGDYAQR